MNSQSSSVVSSSIYLSIYLCLYHFKGNFQCHFASVGRILDFRQPTPLKAPSYTAGILRDAVDAAIGGFQSSIPRRRSRIMISIRICPRDFHTTSSLLTQLRLWKQTNQSSPSWKAQHGPPMFKSINLSCPRHHFCLPSKGPPKSSTSLVLGSTFNTSHSCSISHPIGFSWPATAVDTPGPCLRSICRDAIDVSILRAKCFKNGVHETKSAPLTVK